MNSYVLSFSEIDRTAFAHVGGKGANLGELCKIEGVRVPVGFCVTTDAFAEVVGDRLDVLLDELETGEMGVVSAKIRGVIEGLPIPGAIEAEVMGMLDEGCAYAVRSSATAEDLPTASFAGQQDSYLDVVGSRAILRHISKCWASLFTDRAVAYRFQNGFDHRKVRLAVVVQKMIFPDAAGVLFTADPLTGNRKVVSIEASFGLGEALVSGLVNADVYRVRDEGIERVRQGSAVLSDSQILRLGQLGRAIEAHFGRPQDIEWCLAEDGFWFVQSRPITTLYPIPAAPDNKNRVYVSVGHQQMMTDAIKPLGISFWNLTAFRPMCQAGGRLFVDVTPELASPAGREVLLGVLGKSDPLIRDAFMTILERGFIVPVEDEGNGRRPPRANFQTLQDYDPRVVEELIGRGKAGIEALKRTIPMASGIAVFDFILEDIQRLKKFMSDPQGFGVIMTGMNAAAWINEKMDEWLGEKNVADTIAKSVANNITAEMGMALLDVADVIRPYPEVIEYLEGGDLEGLASVAGGRAALDAIGAFLEKYGMRCAGEIDITRDRWSERPATLIPLLLGNVKNLEPGAGQRRFQQGLREASDKERELLQRVRQLPDGDAKAVETKRMVGLVRNFSGYREYPKYAMISRYWVYKKALLREAERLVGAGVLHATEEIYYLSFEELKEVVGTGRVDYDVVSLRKEAFCLYEKLTPPRVMTSDGEIITGRYNREGLPARAIAGLAVSSGIVEGRARVVLKMEEALLEDGDILVTAFTDPSWTPLFLSIRGLVTEVGGLMTHGAVIAREYGLPAVVGVEKAATLIEDGALIRVNGTEGYVEVL